MCIDEEELKQSNYELCEICEGTGEEYCEYLGQRTPCKVCHNTGLFEIGVDNYLDRYLQ